MGNAKVIKAGAGYTIGNYLLKGLSFFTIPIFARLLSIEDYGLVNTFYSYESIMLVVIGLAIHTSFKNARQKYNLIEEGATFQKDYRTYVSNALTLIWISGILWLILTFCFKIQISNVLKIEPFLLFLLIVYSMCNAIVAAYNADVSINYEYKKYIAIAGINSISNIVISLILICFVWKSNKYVGRIVGSVFPIVLIGIFLTISQLKRARPANFVDMMRWGLKYSLPIVPHGISQIILSSFDRIMITNLVSASATGMYSFAYNVFSILQVTAASIDSVWGPWFYEHRRVEDYKSIRKVSSLYIVFLCTFSMVVILFSPELILFMGGAAYNKAIFCVIPVVCGGYFTFLYNIPSTVEYYHEKTKYIAAATTSAALLNIFLNYVFIRKYGYIAAAYTTLGTYFCYFLFHYFIAKKIEGRCLFSSLIIIISIISILFISVLALFFKNIFFVRLLIVIFIMIIAIIYSEKAIQIITYIKKKLKSR